MLEVLDNTVFLLAMGQGQSQEPVKTTTPGIKVSKVALRLLSELDKLSLREQTIIPETLSSQLGIDNLTGADVYLRSAQFFASFPNGLSERLEITDHIPTVLGFFSQKILEPLGLSTDDYHRLIFLSIAATGVSPEEKASPLENKLSSVSIDSFYIAYQDLLDLWTLLVAVFDKSPSDKFAISITAKDKKAAERLINTVKAPVISFASFKSLLDVYPTILASFSIIFDQLLYPHRSTPSPPPQTPPEIPRDLYCELYLSLGHNVRSMKRLYKGSENGFSMQALYFKVHEWRLPSLLIVTGRLLKSASPLLDTYVPKISGANTRNTKRVAYAVYIHSPWRQVGNFGDSETKIIQLAPEFNVYDAVGPTDHAYFALKKGLSFGVPLPKDDDASQTVKIGNVSLILDNSFEHGVFRDLGPGGSYSIALDSPQQPFEDRFSIDNIELWGIGNEAELQEQSKKLELKEKFQKKRQGHNHVEDRALLEMAGIIGNYPQ